VERVWLGGVFGSGGCGGRERVREREVGCLPAGVCFLYETAAMAAIDTRVAPG
jgi:hypothetical protein